MDDGDEGGNQIEITYRNDPPTMTWARIWLKMEAVVSKSDITGSGVNFYNSQRDTLKISKLNI
jgi:hypothetical protein